ncbi:MAG TPA: hypothetical protein PKE45_20180, partial [Caldilineaceae bacterium]|nr:hypothetical protein [Caldilineaceae bacterium]
MPSPNSQPPRLTHLQRQAGRAARQIALRQQLSTRLATWRLVTFFGGGAISLLALFAVSAGLFWALASLTLLAFVALVYLHRRVERSLHRFLLYSQLISSQLARLRLDWGALPAPRVANPRFDHPFEADLDLVGERSVHRLLDIAVSAQGSALLRSWLTQSQPNLADTLQRQTLVRELLP